MTRPMSGGSEWRGCEHRGPAPAGAGAVARAVRAALLILWAALSLAVVAAPWPLVREIEFTGNDITQAQTMLREMVVRVGDPADPEAIERSRQAIQDLGLFKSVRVEQLPLPDGVKLRFRVNEKWYVLPLPRVEGGRDGNYTYGGELRWNNLWGLNHSAVLQFVKRGFSDRDRAEQTSYTLNYLAPLPGESRYRLATSGGHVSQDSIDPTGRHYDETFDSAELDVQRALTPGPRSQGWTAGAGLLWQREDTRGPFAPAPQGSATALVATVGYSDLHYLIFSERGESFAARYEVAQDSWLSDYGYSRLTVDYNHAWLVGDLPHQEVRLLAATGAYFGGAPSHVRKAFSVGGSGMLRGYDHSTQQGDFYYYAAAEYLRPTFRDWLRLVVLAEAGSAPRSLGETDRRPVLASIGLGLRLRVNWLVDIEVQAGVAVPLVAANGVRLFAGTP